MARRSKKAAAVDLTREVLAADVAEFLRRGNKITVVPTGVSGLEKDAKSSDRHYGRQYDIKKR